MCRHAHFLESWGDALSSEGHYLAIQPMILPLFGGLSELDLLNAVLGKPKVEGPELVQETFRATQSDRRFRDRLVEIFARRFRLAHSAARPAARIQWQHRRRHRAQSLEPPDAAANTGIARDRAGRASYSIDDGRYINNGWLQEMPDPITKLTWDNAALMSPRYAKPRRRDGRSDSNHGERRVADKAPPAKGKPAPPPPPPSTPRELVIAVLISPGHADNSITIPLGYGRDRLTSVGESSGLQWLFAAHR